MRNSYSIAKSCNAAMRHRKRAIYLVAWLTRQVKVQIDTNDLHINN